MPVTEASGHSDNGLECEIGLIMNKRTTSTRKLVYGNTLAHKQSIKIQFSSTNTRRAISPLVMSHLFRQLERLDADCYQ